MKLCGSWFDHVNKDEKNEICLVEMLLLLVVGWKAHGKKTPHTSAGWIWLPPPSCAMFSSLVACFPPNHPSLLITLFFY